MQKTKPVQCSKQNVAKMIEDNKNFYMRFLIVNLMANNLFYM